MSSKVRLEIDINAANHIELIMEYLEVQTDHKRILGDIMNLKLVGEKYDIFLDDIRKLISSVRIADIKINDFEMADIIYSNNMKNFPVTLISRWNATDPTKRDIYLIINEMDFRVGKMVNNKTVNTVNTVWIQQDHLAGVISSTMQFSSQISTVNTCIL